MMQLSQVRSAVNGQMLTSNRLDVEINGVSIDSRSASPGVLFVALDGDRFDGHDYIHQATQQGAAAVLIEKPVPTELPAVLVNDSYVALKELAKWWRAQFVLPVVGITGSVGKTSVKEMLACIFSELNHGLVTSGNLNNEIGVPLTLLRLSARDNYAIIEMGMNHAGEIARLSELVQPTIALINNAAAAHLEGLGSVAAVARAKGEIFSGLSPDGIAVINENDSHATLWKKLAGHRQHISFGLNCSADVTANYLVSATGLSMRVSMGEEEFSVDLAVVGEHNVMNALAAIAVAQAANIPVSAIVAGLASYRPVAGRLNFSTLGALTLIDDTYNANPASMQAAVEVLAALDNTTLIVGDMGELGQAAEQEHRRLGKLAGTKGVDRLLAVGEFANHVVSEFPGDAHSFTDQSELLAHLIAQPLVSGAVLVKGSRAAKMEKTVEYLIRFHTEQANCIHEPPRSI